MLFYNIIHIVLNQVFAQHCPVRFKSNRRHTEGGRKAMQDDRLCQSCIIIYERMKCRVRPTVKMSFLEAI